MSETKPVYVGNAVVKEVNGKQMVKLSINIAQLKEAATTEEWKEAVFESQKGNKYLKLVCFEMKPENQKDWQTHSVKLDTYKSEEKKETVSNEGDKESPSDDLPF